MKPRRPLALALVLAILATALAPLLGALREASAGEALPLCHQAGMQVDAASAPLPPAPGEAPVRQQHCPLCIMVFFASFAAEPGVVRAAMSVVVAALGSPSLPALAADFPASFLSRGPPVTS